MIVITNQVEITEILESKIPFLDFLVHKNFDGTRITTVHRKRTHTGQYDSRSSQVVV